MFLSHVSKIILPVIGFQLLFIMEIKIIFIKLFILTQKYSLDMGHSCWSWINIIFELDSKLLHSVLKHWMLILLIDLRVFDRYILLLLLILVYFIKLLILLVIKVGIQLTIHLGITRILLISIFISFRCVFPLITFLFILRNKIFAIFIVKIHRIIIDTNRNLRKFSFFFEVNQSKYLKKI